MPIERSRIESPLGPVALTVADGRLCGLDFIDSDPPGKGPARSGADLRGRKASGSAAPARSRASGWIASRVVAYFAGELQSLDDIPIAAAGTPFQLRVWAELRRIPIGHTCSYRNIAAALGLPSAARAVGAANGRNPIALVVPCHRVIASGGGLHGYGGGLWRKEWLLRHEGALPPALFDGRGDPLARATATATAAARATPASRSPATGAV